MCDTYPVLIGDHRAGTASVRQEGLYAYISCQCAVNDDQLYRIQLKQANGIIDLGTCLKSADGYRIDTRIPMKLLHGKPEFILKTRSGQGGGFYPIIPNAPFPQLDRLLSGKLLCRDGVMGLIISESDRRGSDQTPEPDDR